MFEDTLIIYTSDHGSHFRTRNSEYKRSCHESSTRIPMVARGPGFIGGYTVDSLSSLIDVPPSVISAAGGEVPHYMRGIALQDIRAGRAGREEVFVQISESHVGRCLRTPDWKYAVRGAVLDGYAAPGVSEYEEDCLYNLKKDPFEKENLAGVPWTAPVRRGLREKISEYIFRIEGVKVKIFPAGGSSDSGQSE